MPDVIVNLSRILKTHAGDMKTLTIREPTARDYINMRKVPFALIFHQEIRPTRPDGVGMRTGEMTTDYELAFQWAERLTGVEILLLETLKGRDIGAVIEGLREQLMNVDIDQTNETKVDEQVKNSSASAQT